MGKRKIVKLSEGQRQELEKDYRALKSHAFRIHCQMILLKSENRTFEEVSEILDCCEVVVVNSWQKCSFSALSISRLFAVYKRIGFLVLKIYFK